MISGEQILAMLTQAKDEALDNARKVTLDPSRLADFEAGFLSGWREAVRTLTLHMRSRL